MSVTSGTGIALPVVTWEEISKAAPFPPLYDGSTSCSPLAERVGREIRVSLWMRGVNSPEAIREEFRKSYSRLNESQREQADLWEMPLRLALERRDPCLTELPTLEGIVDVIARLAAWWPSHWEAVNASDDPERRLADTDSIIVCFLDLGPNTADSLLGRLVWLNRLRVALPGRPVTLEELRALERHREVLAVGEKYMEGLSPERRELLRESLECFAKGELSIPRDADALAEATLTNSLPFQLGPTRMDYVYVAAILLRIATELRVAGRDEGYWATHPTAGYAMIIHPSRNGANASVDRVSPGLWRLRIEGDQYVISCELWPGPVVMSPDEFARARGSARAIMRDVGISVDSPPGHWKAVWEKHGLRNHLLQIAERVDPRARLEELRAWVQRISGSAPAADRPPEDGSCVRLPDGHVVAKPAWLIEQALADGVISAHERPLMEKAFRGLGRETNRRDANRRQQRMLVIDAPAGPLGIASNSEAVEPRLENDEAA